MVQQEKVLVDKIIIPTLKGNISLMYISLFVVLIISPMASMCQHTSVSKNDSPRNIKKLLLKRGMIQYANASNNKEHKINQLSSQFYLDMISGLKSKAKVLLQDSVLVNFVDSITLEKPIVSPLTNILEHTVRGPNNFSKIYSKSLVSHIIAGSSLPILPIMVSNNELENINDFLGLKKIKTIKDIQKNKKRALFLESSIELTNSNIGVRIPNLKDSIEIAKEASYLYEIRFIVLDRLGKNAYIQFQDKYSISEAYYKFVETSWIKVSNRMLVQN